MKSDICLRNGVVVTPNGIINGGVAIKDGIIVHVGPEDELGEAHRVIDVNGNIIMPGLFDPHIHFGVGGVDMNDEIMEEDFKSETKDCLIGGVTTIATTTLIGASLADEYERARKCGTGASWCDFKLTCVVLNEGQLQDFPGLIKHGIADFKFFTGYVGEQAASFGMSEEGISPGLFYTALKKMSESQRTTFAKIHAEDPYVRGILVDRARAVGAEDSLIAWAETTPEWAESLQVYTYGLVASEHNIPMYPVHISSGHTVDTVKEMRQKGLDIVGETLTLFLNTTAEEMQKKGYSSEAKIQPPIRFQKDQDRLWRGIQEGDIKIIGTDSVPHTKRSGYKKGGFWHCKVGVNNQTLDTLPLLYDKGVHSGRIDLQRLVEITSSNAAKMYGIYPKKGAIQKGSDADLVILDPNKEQTLGVERSRGESDYSLWQGRKAYGVPVMTLLRGQVVAEHGEIVGKADGKYIE